MTAINTTFGSGLVNEGIALDEPKDGYLTDSKDAGVDVIAWKNSADNLPGKLLMFGQVASGYNWEDKSIKNDIDTFKNTFFSDFPQSPPIPSMFIPFCISPNSNGTLRNRMNGLAEKFGIVYYRYRLPKLAEQGWLAVGNVQDTAESFVHHLDESGCFQETVEAFFNQLLASTPQS
jgi:hypothetical protein